MVIPTLNLDHLNLKLRNTQDQIPKRNEDEIPNRESVITIGNIAEAMADPQQFDGFCSHRKGARELSSRIRKTIDAKSRMSSSSGSEQNLNLNFSGQYRSGLLPGTQISI